MKSSFKIFQVKGIEVKLHITLLILFLLPVLELSYSENLGEGLIYALYSFGFFVALFSSVLIHELSHSFVAMRNGIGVKQIILWPLGGIASLGMVKDPMKEFKISIAGPLASFAIGFGLLFILLGAVGFDAIVETFLIDDFISLPSLFNFAFLIMYMNFILAAFNLFLPIFPMDGGRVLRSLLSMVTDRVRATKIAVSIGQGFLALFILVALVYGFWLWIAIAVFLFLAGLTELRLTEMAETAEHTNLKRAVKTGFIVLHPDLKVRDFLQIVVSQQNMYPVLDNNEKPIGVVEPARLNQKSGAVKDVMRTDIPTIKLTDNREELLAKIFSNGYALVLDSHDKLYGVLTAKNLENAMKVEELKHQH